MFKKPNMPDHSGAMDDPMSAIFNPTDEEMVHHLLNKVIGKTPPAVSEVIMECDLYGEEEAWKNVFEETRLNCLYFFTKLKKTTEKSSRFSRATGWCNTWKTQSDKKICMGEKHIGAKRCFTFMEKEKPRDDQTPSPRWTMHEYRLDGAYHSLNQGNDYVICRIRRIVSKKVAAKQQELAGEGEKTLDDPMVILPNDQEMEVHLEGGDSIVDDNKCWAAVFAQELLAHSQGCLDEEKEDQDLLPNPFYEAEWVRGWEIHPICKRQL